MKQWAIVYGCLAFIVAGASIGVAQPLQPVEPLKPAKPLKPIEPLKKVAPLKPVEPLKKVEPLKPVSPLTAPDNYGSGSEKSASANPRSPQKPPYCDDSSLPDPPLGALADAGRFCRVCVQQCLSQLAEKYRAQSDCPTAWYKPDFIANPDPRANDLCRNICTSMVGGQPMKCSCSPDWQLRFTGVGTALSAGS